MSWTQNVVCTRCNQTCWQVIFGVWTCSLCRKPMTVHEVAEYHRILDAQR